MIETRSTIFALSSGQPPAAIAVVRLSGPQAGSALEQVIGAQPQPRRARIAEIRNPSSGELLDRALVLWLPGPASATGEDVAELHLHGGRAVVDGVLSALGELPGLRPAEAGEFTRRAFENGRIDLNEAEGLADLLTAETAGQRRAALLAAGGALSRQVEAWREQLLGISAAIEAGMDYADEEDVATRGASGEGFGSAAAKLADEMADMLALPPAERLREGIRVVVAGPPNSGKSSLVNALAQRDAAIESPVAGTTRDVIEVPVAIGGLPLLLVDTAGLRDAQDEVEGIGIARAERAIEAADILVWLGDGAPPDGENVLAIFPRSDIRTAPSNRLHVSSKTGENLTILVGFILDRARNLLPGEGEATLNRRQRIAIGDMVHRTRSIGRAADPIVAAEEARAALVLCGQLTGRTGVEDMLDALFGRFCIGK